MAKCNPAFLAASSLVQDPFKFADARGQIEHVYRHKIIYNARAYYLVSHLSLSPSRVFRRLTLETITGWSVFSSGGN